MYHLQPMDAESARAMFGWFYDEPYAMYNFVIGADGIEAGIAFFVDPQNHYYGIKDDRGELLGYCCFGAEATVPGGDYSPDALDVGAGMRPDLTGQGRGHEVIEAALELGRELFHPARFRATIAAYNQRAQRAVGKIGFVETSRFNRESDGLQFVIFIRNIS